MRHRCQPRGSRLCGQSCVAMILGISVLEAVELIGKCGATKTRHLRETLYILKTIPVDNQGRNWHWVVYERKNGKGVFHDPENTRKSTLLPMLMVSSYMRVEKESE